MAWEKIASRNYSVLSTCTHIQGMGEGVYLGKVFWKCKKQLLIKNNIPSKMPLTDIFYLYTEEGIDSNFADFIKEINEEQEKAYILAEGNIEKDLLLVPGKTRKDCKFFFDRLKLELAIMVMGHYFTGLIEKELRKQIDGKIYSKIKMGLMNPHKPPSIVQEHIALEELRKKNLSSDEIKKAASELAEKFGFLHSEYRGRAWDVNDYINEIKQEPGTEESNELDLNEYGFNEYILWLCDMAKKWTYVYDEGKTALVRCMWALRETVKSLDVNEENVLLCAYEEFLDWIENGELPSSDVLSERNKYFATILGNGEIKNFFTEKDIAELIEKEEIPSYETVEKKTSISGQIAFPGKVKGKVRKVFSYKDAEALEEGEILVASMTTPELLAAMRKAGGFVTDEGGITSHAAIIAREMKTPCIIGTKVATRIFEDGDLVELNDGKVTLL